jgi:ABC-type amino acid transport system permease subunit
MAESRPSTFNKSAHTPVPIWRDIRFIQVVAQILFLVVVIIFSYLLINNLVTGLEKSRLAINFGILSRPFGTQISEGQMDFDPGSSSNIQALWADFKIRFRSYYRGLVPLGIAVGIGPINNFG